MFRAVATVVCCLFWAPLSAAAQQPSNEWERLAREIFEELVEINTAHSVGGTLEAAEAMARRLRAEGWPDGDVVVTEVAPREGNLVARLRGRDAGKKPILLLAHIDVVEADPEDWTLPPFEFIEQDGSFFGRGVADGYTRGARVGY